MFPGTRWVVAMALKRKLESSVAAHRRRQAARGLRRVEVLVPATDAALLRKVAAALTDPREATSTRVYLNQRFAPPPRDFKAFLQSAPDFDLLDLTRSKDTGRDIEW